MNKKVQTVIGLVWLGIISFLIMNFNIPLLCGVIIGAAYRLYHGTAISFACGITFGILIVQICKFLTFKM